jgi:hypothetical protein
MASAEGGSSRRPGPQGRSPMANPIIAHSAQETTTRTDRGREFYAERAHEFRFERGVWYVPCSSVEGRVYEVRLEPVEACECRDFEVRGEACKHIVAVRIAHARSGVCSCCRSRVLWRFLSEVTEDDGLLAWYPGDELCADCITEGYWA